MERAKWAGGPSRNTEHRDRDNYVRNAGITASVSTRSARQFTSENTYKRDAAWSWSGARQSAIRASPNAENASSSSVLRSLILRFVGGRGHGCSWRNFLIGRFCFGWNAAIYTIWGGHYCGFDLLIWGHTGGTRSAAASFPLRSWRVQRAGLLPWKRC